MIWPPSVLRVRIDEKGSRKINLWIPLFLFWPLIVLGALLFPLALAMSSELRKKMKVDAVVVSGPQLLALFAALRGLKVNVGGKNDRVYVELW